MEVKLRELKKKGRPSGRKAACKQPIRKLNSKNIVRMDFVQEGEIF